MPSFIRKLKSKLTKTHNIIASRVDDLLSYYKDIDDAFFEELEEILITADMGMNVSLEIVAEVKSQLKSTKTGNTQAIHEILRKTIAAQMKTSNEDMQTPAVILMVGVNGTGKTTTAAKLAALHKADGKNVMLCLA